jgi:hypothetical protein
MLAFGPTVSSPITAHGPKFSAPIATHGREVGALLATQAHPSLSLGYVYHSGTRCMATDPEEDFFARPRHG